jgi:hypothetical protein
MLAEGQRKVDGQRPHLPSLVLYQGPTLIGPSRTEREKGFSPCYDASCRESVGAKEAAENVGIA